MVFPPLGPTQDMGEEEMNEKSKAIERCISCLLDGRDSEGLEILREQWPDKRESCDMVYRLANLPQLKAIRDLCVCMSGELAFHLDSSELELREAKNIADLLIGHAERLIEIGQENEADHDSLVVIGATIESLGESIKGLFDHLKRRDGVE